MPISMTPPKLDCVKLLGGLALHTSRHLPGLLPALARKIRLERASMMWNSWSASVSQYAKSKPPAGFDPSKSWKGSSMPVRRVSGHHRREKSLLRRGVAVQSNGTPLDVV